MQLEAAEDMVKRGNSERLLLEPKKRLDKAWNQLWDAAKELASNNH